MSDVTPTGIPIIWCEECGKSHPETRMHCCLCGAASVFSHEVHGVVSG